MRIEPTTYALRVFGLRRNFVKAFLDLEVFSKSFSSRAFLARVVQEPLAVGHNQWCPLMAKDFNFVSGQENFFRI